MLNWARLFPAATRFFPKLLLQGHPCTISAELILWSLINLYQNRLEKQSGPGADEEWLHKATSYHHGGQQRRFPREEGCKPVKQGCSSHLHGRKGTCVESWSFAVDQTLCRLTFPSLSPTLSSLKYLCVPCSKKCNTESTTKSVLWYRFEYADVDGVTCQKFGSFSTCPWMMCSALEKSHTKKCALFRQTNLLSPIDLGYSVQKTSELELNQADLGQPSNEMILPTALQ